MELRLVDRNANRELSFPFANDCMREKGSGVVKIDGSERPLIMQDGRVAMCASGSLSPALDGKHLSYLRLTDKEIGCCAEYCWSAEEWHAFIVNDNGKTIDKIVS